MMPQNIWTIFITHAAVQGLLICLLLLVMRRGNIGVRQALAALLLLLSLLTLNFLMEYFQWYKGAPHLIWVVAPLWFALGPLLLLFARHATRRGFGLEWRHALHLLPTLGAALYIRPFYLLPAEAKPEVFRKFYASEQFLQHDFFFYGYTVLLAIYAWMAYMEFRRYFNGVGEEHARASVYEFRWVRGIMLAIAAFVLVSLGYNVLLRYDFRYFIEADFLTFLFLSVSIQAVGVFALLHPGEMFVSPLEEPKKGGVASDALDEERLATLAEETLRLLRLEKPYLNPDLRLSNLAMELDVPAHLLSQAINQQLGKNFFELVNSFRVEEVKACLEGQQYGHYTLFAIAQRCGFNSSASFYRIFKQQEGVTPREYKARIAKQRKRASARS